MSPRCQHDSCKNIAKCGYADDNVIRFCLGHKRAGMVRQWKALLAIQQAAAAYMLNAV